MKPRNLVIATVLFMAGCFTGETFAQENIKTLIKKCENMDVIDADIIRSKAVTTTSSSQTSTNTSVTRSQSNTPRSIVNITLKYTPALEKELVAAFRKDQEKAIHEVEQKKDGKVSHMLYRFNDSEYSFTIKNDTITIRATEGGTQFGLFNAVPMFSYNGFDSTNSMPTFSLRLNPFTIRDSLPGLFRDSFSNSISLRYSNPIILGRDSVDQLDAIVKQLREALLRTRGNAPSDSILRQTLENQLIKR